MKVLLTADHNGYHDHMNHDITKTSERLKRLGFEVELADPTHYDQIANSAAQVLIFFAFSCCKHPLQALGALLDDRPVVIIRVMCDGCDGGIKHLIYGSLKLDVPDEQLTFVINEAAKMNKVEIA